MPARLRHGWTIWRQGMLALLMLVLLPVAAHAAPTFPAFTGLVTDAANILPPDRKAALQAKLEALQQQTGKQLVVATIPDLQGYTLEDYGYQLGRAWAVGLKNADNGVILFIAPNEPAGHRGPRIEVGYGEEAVVTDAVSSVIINTRMMPLLRNGQVPDALDAGADALSALMRLPDDQAKAKAAAAIAEYNKAHRARQSNGHIPFGAIIWIVIVGVVIVSHVARRVDRNRQRWGHDSNLPIWLWAASEVMRDSNRHSGWGGGSSWGGGGGSDSGGGGGWMGGGFTGGGGGSFGGGGASGSW